MDKLAPGRRSINMAAIRAKNTKPEMIVRRLVHQFGYRYRLHQRDLPGKPDLVFTRHRKAIFVHGCFWHQHSACREGRVPNSRVEYWGPKLARNVIRDRAALAGLAKLGWKVLVVWECETKDQDRLGERLKEFIHEAARIDEASLSDTPR